MTKLEVGAANDPLEREADEIADRVVQMEATPALPRSGRAATLPVSPDLQVVRRTCSECAATQALEEEEATGILRRALAGSSGPDLIRRSCCECEGEGEGEDDTLRLQRGAGVGGGRVDSSFAAKVDSRMQGGNPLSAGVRGTLEPRLGAELGALRTHTDAASGALAQSINARAFTLGHHIFFAPGELRTNTRSGVHLLTHEVAHTMQSGRQPSLQRQLLRKEANCASNDKEEEELAAAEHSRPLKNWLERVKTKDLRHDMLRGIRSRRARRVCLAAACKLDGFDGLTDETKQKLACFDEAQKGGDLEGVCYEKLEVRCPTGPAAPLKWKREAAIKKAVRDDLDSKNYDLVRDEQRASHEWWNAFVVAEFVRARKRVEFARSTLRLMYADRTKAGNEKIHRRSKAAEEAFLDVFGQLDERKFKKVNSILEKVEDLMEAGWGVTPAYSSSGSESESESDSETTTSSCIDPRSILADVESAYGPEVYAACKDPCLDKYACLDGFAACIERCRTTTEKDEGASENYLEDPDAIPGGPVGSPPGALPGGLLGTSAAASGQPEPAAESVPPEPDQVASTWVDESRHTPCAGVAGYFDPNTNQIVMCVDKSSPVRRVTRDGFRATLLHEYLHRALGEAQIDIYSNTPLYPMLSALQLEIEGEEPGTKVNETLSVLNPDSHVEFILRAAGTAQQEVDNSVPHEAPASGTADACKIQRAQFVLGVAYQWVRWGIRAVSLEIAENKLPNTSDQARLLQRLRAKQSDLTEPGKQKRSLIDKPRKRASADQWSALQPPSIHVAEGQPKSSGTLEKSEAIMNLSLPPSFFARSDLDAQVRAMLGYMKVASADVTYLADIAKDKEDAALLAQVEEGLGQC